MSLTLKDLSRLCSQAEKKGLLEEWLHFLFTPAELENLDKRLDIIAALLQNTETQREMAKNHEISIAKITRGSNALKTISPALKQFLLKNMGAR